MAVVQQVPRARIAPQVPLMILAAVLWSVGWLAAKVALAALWVAAAVGLGWSDGRTPRRRD